MANNYYTSNPNNSDWDVEFTPVPIKKYRISFNHPGFPDETVEATSHAITNDAKVLTFWNNGGVSAVYNMGNISHFKVVS